MLKLSKYARFYSTSSKPSRPLLRRIVTRLVSPPANYPKESGWKQWIAHMRKDSKKEMEHLQAKIMSDVVVEGSADNKLLMGEINQWHFHNPKGEIRTPTLLVHGYAASSMGFHRNFPGLSQSIKDLYAIDLPASGLSPALPLEMRCTQPLDLKINMSKDTFSLPYTINYLHHKSLIQNYEDYYLDAIEQWRHDNKLGPINIVAHSFGGYLSFKYAVKFPHAVEKLCLVSPLGVERNIFSVNNQWRSNTSYNLDFENPASKFYIKKGPAIPRLVFEQQTQLLRNLGPLGAKLSWNYINAAYSRVPSLDYKKYVFELLYGKNGLNQTSKDLFIGLFNNRVLARDPLLDSIQFFGKSAKLMCIYGDHDWMNRRAGMEMVNEANQLGIEAKYNEVSSSGHNLFLDNPEEFNDKLVRFLKL